MCKLALDDEAVFVGKAEALAETLFPPLISRVWVLNDIGHFLNLYAVTDREVIL